MDLLNYVLGFLLPSFDNCMNILCYYLLLCSNPAIFKKRPLVAFPQYGCKILGVSTFVFIGERTETISGHEAKG